MTESAMSGNGAQENISISFDTKILGYDKDEVDRYVKLLADAYQAAYDEYHVKCKEYDELLECSNMLDSFDQCDINTEVMTKALIDAEVMADKIISHARREAEKIKEEIFFEKFEAKVFAKNTINDANAEAASLKETAQKTLDDAVAEAAAVRRQSIMVVDIAGA